jgi:hypothetical protein
MRLSFFFGERTRRRIKWPDNIWGEHFYYSPLPQFHHIRSAAKVVGLEPATQRVEASQLSDPL